MGTDKFSSGAMVVKSAKVSIANAGDSGRQAYPAATLVRHQCNLRDAGGFSALAV